MTLDSGKTSEQIKAEIDQTRAGMSNKIDTIQDRLNPDNLKQQAQNNNPRFETLGSVTLSD